MELLGPPTSRKKRYNYGESDMDLFMQDMGPLYLLWEVKTDKQKWSQRHASALEGIEALHARNSYYVFQPACFASLVKAYCDAARPCSFRSLPVKPLKGYATMLLQPEEYASRQREEKPVFPALLMQLRRGRGRPWARHIVLGEEYVRELKTSYQIRTGAGDGLDETRTG